MPAPPRLDVYLQGELVGRLERPGSGRLRFAYEPAVAARWPGDLLLSAALPVREAPYPNGETKPYFEGVLPEGRIRDTIERELRVPPGDAFRLLEEIGADCAGAVVVLPAGAEPPPAVARIRADWLTEAELAGRIEELPAHPLGVGIGRARLSLAGVQSKLLVTKAPDGRTGVPVGGSPSTHIVKPEQPEFPGIAANEAYCLRIARACSLPAAAAVVRRIGDRPCLVVERFDRVYAGDDSIRRLHQEDLCQALGKLPGQKYESDGGPSAAGIVAIIRRTSTRPAADVTVFLRALALNVLLGNSDAHAKNFALLHEPLRHASLAPLYDIVSTQAYDVEQRLAMSIGGAEHPGDVDEGAWRELARSCGVNDGLLIRDVTRLAGRVSAAADAVREEALAEGWHEPIVDRIREVCRARAGLVAAPRPAPRAPGTGSGVLQADLLRGRIHATTLNPAVSSADTALVVRAGYALRLRPPREARLGSAEQDAFEAAVEESSLESWARRVAREPAPGEGWRATDPTRSIVVTVRRPAVPLRSGPWTLESRASLSVGTPPGGLLLLLDTVVRPLDGQGEPAFSPEALLDLLRGLVASAVDEIAPQALRPIGDSEPTAFAVVVSAAGLPLSTFVRLEPEGGERAEGARDATGGEWAVESVADLENEDRRVQLVRGWIGDLYRESGWKHYEAAVQQLEPPPPGFP